MASVEALAPYQPNAQGLTEVLIDLKSTMPSQTVFKVTGYETTCFENVTQGDAVYARASDGQVGKAIANADASANATVKVIVIGLKTMSGLDAGDLYFLSPSTAGAITLTPPSTTGQAVVRVGEASTATQFAIRIEPPIKLS